MVSDKVLEELQMTRKEWDDFVKVNDEYNEAMRKYEQDNPPPKCHFTFMHLEYADNGNGGGVSFWECSHCGHTKEEGYVNYNTN